MNRVKNQKDFWSGLLFLVFGLGVISLARDYPFGTTTRMGPGFFPMVLASLLAVLGVIIIVRACLTRQRVAVGALHLKPLLLVVAATVGYGLLLPEAGFIAVTFLCIMVSARASQQGSWLAQTILAVSTTVCCLLIFIKGLGLPMALLGTWFG